MVNLKRAIYGLPLLAPYRRARTNQLARRVRDHADGFKFAGTDAFFRPSWEAKERAAVSDRLRSAAVFVDVGANQGIYTCLAASMGKHVVAIEPEAGNLRFLLGNIAANKFKVEVYPVALGDEPGVLELYGDGDTASLVAGWAGSSRQFVQRVPVNRLDNVIGDRFADEKIVVKIDVEGFEREVLSGAAALINRPNPPVWMIETTPRLYTGDRRKNPGYTFVFETMFAAGYSCRDVDSSSEVTKEQVGRWASLEEESPPGSNFIFYGAADI
jgi:FkbM family methyltransferase